MSAISYLEALKGKRQKHLESLAKVEDGEAFKHTRIKGVMQGLEEAEAIYREHLKSDEET